MLKAIAATLALSIIGSPIAASAGDADVAMGLLKMCEAYLKNDTGRGERCLFYFVGYQEGYAATVNAYPEAITKDNVGPFCPVGVFTPEMMIRVFVNYGEKHPERMGVDWMTAVTTALGEAWPCK